MNIMFGPPCLSSTGSSSLEARKELDLLMGGQWTQQSFAVGGVEYSYYATDTLYWFMGRLNL